MQQHGDAECVGAAHASAVPPSVPVSRPVSRPSLSVLVIFILFAARRPHHLSTRLSTVILSALTRRVLPDARLEMG